MHKLRLADKISETDFVNTVKINDTLETALRLVGQLDWFDEQGKVIPSYDVYAEVARIWFFEHHDGIAEIEAFLQTQARADNPAGLSSPEPQKFKPRMTGRKKDKPTTICELCSHLRVDHDSKLRCPVPGNHHDGMTARLN